MRKFDTISSPTLKEVESFPKVTAIDEYKEDTTEGKYQVIIADGEIGKPLDILPNRPLETVKSYLREKGAKGEIVIMDMSHAFKSAVRKALGKPIIVDDGFHFCRYIYWAVERVRRRVQKDAHDYDRRKCKRMKHVFYKRYEDLSKKQHWWSKRGVQRVVY